MIKVALFLFTLTLFSACSFKTPPNEWQHKSINAFSSYTNNFLSSRDLLAKNDLKRAITHAKSTADLTTLGKIYLGVCALNISVGIEDSCTDYQNIRPTLKNKPLDTYYSLLTADMDSHSIKALPPQYQSFTQNLLAKKYTQANRDVIGIDKITSKILAGALLGEHIEEGTIEDIIEKSSLYGYKKSVLYWLQRLKVLTKDRAKQEIINKKIEVLNE